MPDTSPDSDYFPQPTPSSGTRTAPVAEPYKRVRTEEVDTAKIRAEAAQEARRDILLQTMHKRIKKMDETQDGVVGRLDKGERRMDKAEIQADNRHTQIAKQVEGMEEKLDRHIDQHQLSQQARQSRWAGVLPQVLATVIASLITAAVVGGIVAASIPSSKPQPSPTTSKNP